MQKKQKLRANSGKIRKKNSGKILLTYTLTSYHVHFFLKIFLFQIRSGAVSSSHNFFLLPVYTEILHGFHISVSRLAAVVRDEKNSFSLR